MGLVFDEGQFVDQRENRNIFRRLKPNFASKGDKIIPHVMLVDIVIDNFDDCREGLTLLRFVILQLWGIEDHPIAWLHPLQWRSFAVVSLNKPTCQSALNMIF